MVALLADTRSGHPAEVATLCVLLGSDEATYMTVATFTLDGLLAGSGAAPARD